MNNLREDRVKSIASRILNEDVNEVYLLPAESSTELENGDNPLLLESELVHHSILLLPPKGGTAPIRLDFEAEGGFQSLIGGEHPHTPILPLSEILSRLNSSSCITGKKVLEAYQQAAFTASPQCVPCDSDYIASFDTRLVLINGVMPSRIPKFCVNEFGIIDDGFGTLGGLSLDLIENLLNSNPSQLLENDSGHSGFTSVKPIIVRGEEVSSDQLIESYTAGSCYEYVVSNLVLMVEDEDEDKYRHEWDRICVDLLAESDESKEVLSAIGRLVGG